MPKSSKTAPSPRSGQKRRKNPVNISVKQREKMIAEAAYYLAEQRGFDGGDPMADWLQAESQIEKLLH